MAEKKIDGVTYRTKSPAPSQIIRFSARITKVAGSALGEMFSGGPDAMARAMTALSSTMDEDAVVKLIVDLCELAEFNDEGTFMSIQYDVHFQGRLKSMPKVLTFVLEAEFADFFSAINPLSQGNAAA